MRLSKDAADGIPWDAALWDKGAEKSWELFKDIFLRAQELSLAKYKKSGKEARRPAWLSEGLLFKLKCKKETRRQWKQGHISWEKYRDAARIRRNGIREAEA